MEGVTRLVPRLDDGLLLLLGVPQASEALSADPTHFSLDGFTYF